MTAPTSTTATHWRTVFLVGLLHACTHIYHVALLPLYLLIQRDLNLTSVDQATALVTALMLAYYLPSYFLGVLADHHDRKKLLTLGLALNAGGFLGLASARSYWEAIAWMAVSGVGGSFYHPTATALIARLFPHRTGKALGYVGVGASVGFFVGPLYSGWRAASAGWRAPVIELGILGLVIALLFYLLAENDTAEETSATHVEARRIGIPKAIYLILMLSALAFTLRDFAGAAMASLGSLFLQKAHGFTTNQTGIALSSIFLASAISNPLFGSLSDRSRLSWTAAAIITSAMLIMIFPLVPARYFTITYAAYGFFFLASFPMVEAALMESTHDAIRGRVFGFFITVGGVLGNVAHWFVGDRVKALGSSASSPDAYRGLYLGLALMLLLSLAGLPLLRRLRTNYLKAQRP